MLQPTHPRRWPWTWVPLLVFIAQSGWSQTVWTGGGANSNWSNGANWEGGVAPTSSPATQVEIPYDSKTPYVDDSLVLNRLDFVGKSGVAPVSHVVRGAALRFEGAAPRVSNFSQRWQSLECPVEIPASNLAVVAGSQIYLSGVVSGAGGLEFDAPNFSSAGLTPPSDNLYQGLTTVKGLLTLATGAGRIAIPGDLRLDHGHVYLWANSIAADSAVTLADGAWLNVLGPNRIGSIQFDGPGPGSINVADDLTITGAEETWYSGGLTVAANLVKEQPAPIRLSGDLSGGGRIAANVVATGRISRPWEGEYDTLDFEGDLTLGDGATLNFDLGADTNTPLIAIGGGAFQTAAPTGIAVNVYDSGTFGAGSYVLLDWTAATNADVRVDDFQLGDRVAGYTYAFSIRENRLVLEASGPSRNLHLQAVALTNGVATLTVAGVVPNRLYRLERSAGPPDANWIEIGFPYSTGSELAVEDFEAGSFEKAFYRIAILP